MNRGIKSKNIFKQLVYIRHGSRPMYEPEKMEKWKKTSRYIANKYDDELTETGIRETKQTAFNLLNLINANNFKYIYSSPLIRCVQTSAIIVDTLRTYYPDLDPKIRIEYGLREDQNIGFFCPIQFVGKEMEYGHFAETSIDSNLSPESIYAKFPNHIDNTYTSLAPFAKVIPRNINHNILDLVNTVDKITNENNNSIIVSHGGLTYYFLHMFLTQNKFVTNMEEYYQFLDKVGSNRTLNFVSIYNKLYSNFELVFGPQRII